MTEPLTDPQLAAMQAREQAATPPPWHAVEAADSFVTVIHSDGPNAKDLARVSALTSDADGQFMAHARTDMPALLADNARLRAELEQARAVERRLADLFASGQTWQDDRLVSEHIWTCHEIRAALGWAEPMTGPAIPADPCRAEAVHQAGCPAATEEQR